MIPREVAAGRRAAEVVSPQAFPEPAEPGVSLVVLVKQRGKHR